MRMASSQEWVTKIHVARVSFKMVSVSSRISSRSCVSRPENGSSIISTPGRGAIARARATRCCSPPDRIWGYSPAYFASPTRSRADCATRWASSRAKALSPNAVFSSNVRCGNRAKSWNISPTPRRSGGIWIPGPATTTSLMRMRPPVGRSSPAVRRRSVVLPHPEGPTRQTISPGAISRLTPRTAWIEPNLRWTSSNVSRAAMIAAAEPRTPQRLAAGFSLRLDV